MPLFTLRIVRMALLVLLAVPSGALAKIQFVKRELFRIPFGDPKESLGSKVVDGQLLIPRNFSLDGSGNFYINDANRHRIVRYSWRGAYQMSLQYPATARQVFAQPDGQNNLWLLISDPVRGFYYGVYDSGGKRLREGVFAQYNHFRLHVDDARVLHLLLSNEKRPQEVHLFVLDQKSFLLKKIKAAKPPEEHHHLTTLERSYFIDPVPTHAKQDSDRRAKITDASHQTVGTLKGRVVYVTDPGEIYTRVGECRFEIYSLKGALTGEVQLEALSPTCAGARFDPQGHIYLLDGIPDASGQYSDQMPGMRLMIWERR